MHCVIKVLYMRLNSLTLGPPIGILNIFSGCICNTSIVNTVKSQWISYMLFGWVSKPSESVSERKRAALDHRLNLVLNRAVVEPRRVTCGQSYDWYLLGGSLLGPTAGAPSYDDD